MSKPMIFHILGRMNNQLCQLFGASPGYQGFDPYTFHCLFFTVFFSIIDELMTIFALE